MKPMLASKLDDPAKLKFPVYVSPKLDGVRCIIHEERPYSRNLKLIPNNVVQDILSGLPPMDGELICGPPTAPDVFQRTSSGVMSKEGIPHFKFYVFDCITRAPMPFKERLELAGSYTRSSPKLVMMVPHKLVHKAEALLDYEAEQLLAGYEGIMIRDPAGLYKQGRSTVREGGLLKLKRFEDSEAKVLGFVEKEHNQNEQTRDELGRAKRSSHKAGKVGADTLGALVVQDVVSGQRFNIGTGFSESERADIWGKQGSFLGRLVKYRYQSTGVKDAPRFPTFAGWRDPADT